MDMDLLKLNMTELKIILQRNNMPTMGTKTELIARIQEEEPTWIADTAILTAMIDNEENLTQTEDTGVQVQGTIEQSVLRDDWYSREMKLVKMLEHGKYEDMAQFHMMRVNSLRDKMSSRISMNKIDNISKLLSKFDGSSDFECWKAEINSLRNKYELDEGACKILIMSRLYGDAKEWHSLNGNFDLKVDDLLEKMDNMFIKQLRKLERRKQFEVRKWKETETFSEYCHDKMILGNQVPIAEDEMVDYILDGIPKMLRNKAQSYSFASVHELIRKFDRIKINTIETSQQQYTDGNQYPKPISNADDMLKKEEEIHSVKSESQDEFQRKELLRKKGLRYSQKRPFPCPKCDKAYNTKVRLINHLNENEPYELQYICKICGQIFEQIIYFKIHFKRHERAFFVDIQNRPLESRFMEIQPNPHYSQ